MGDLLARYEDFVLSIGTRPTVALFLAIFVILALIGAIGYRNGTRSFRMWFWFCLTNVGVWAFLYWGSRLSQSNSDHVRLILIHVTIITGHLFGFALARRVLGREDRANPYP